MTYTSLTIPLQSILLTTELGQTLDQTVHYRKAFTALYMLVSGDTDVFKAVLNLLLEKARSSYLGWCIMLLSANRQYARFKHIV